MHRLLVVRGPIDAEEWDIAQWSEHEDGLEGHCAKGMRFENDPNNGDVPHDTVCKDCVLPADVNGCNGDGYDCDMWSGFPCKPKMPHGAIFNDCAECGGYEYYAMPCNSASEVDAPFNDICKPCAMNFGLQTLGDGSVEYLYGEIDNCPMENHRCLPNGSPFQAAMGLDAATMRKAAAHEADDLAHNDFAGELALAERSMDGHVAVRLRPQELR